MFVRSFVEIAAPYADADAALTRDSQGWLPGLASSVGEGGEARMAEVGFGSAVRVERSVVVTVGVPARIEFKTLLPIAWRPSHTEALLPAIEAEIELAPMGDERTQLAMTARYTPPFGLLGRVADRALLHRVAEATVKDFVERVAARLEELLDVGQPRAAGGGVVPTAI
jgi:hypothetical protein